MTGRDVAGSVPMRWLLGLLTALVMGLGATWARGHDAIDDRLTEQVGHHEARIATLEESRRSQELQNAAIDMRLQRIEEKLDRITERLVTR